MKALTKHALAALLAASAFAKSCVLLDPSQEYSAPQCEHQS